MIFLITGGARSGKSKFAESIYQNEKDVVYIATSRATDSGMRERINLHKKTRPPEWRTYEASYNLCQSIGNEKNYILDCITILASNIMFDMSKDMEYIDYEEQEKIENAIIFEIENLINSIKYKGYNLILVTNEVGNSIVPKHHISGVFRDIQGRVNQKIANMADKVYLVCCGIPVNIK